jgi:hypothetical protein
MKEIPLTNGGAAIVDDEDYDYLMQWNWRMDHKGYAVRTTTINHVGVCFIMHRIVANTPQGMQTDHINRNKLDNRRANLRHCTAHQNMANMERKNKYIGVQWKPRRGVYEASVWKGGKSVYVGQSKDIHAAAAMRNEAVKKLYGDSAVLNVIE